MKPFSLPLAVCALLGGAAAPASATTFSLDFLIDVATGGTLPVAAKPATVSDATTVLERLAPAAYPDGIGALAELGRPNPRDLSNTLSIPENAAHDPVPLSNLAVAFSQLIASHEIARSPTNAAEPINVPVAADDPVAVSSGGVPVMPQSRATAAPGTGVSTPREQLNDVSVAFDGSTVYGSDQATQDLLRAGDGTGRMRVAPDGGLVVIGGRRKAGDVRADENLVLTSLHTLFVQEHNRLADEIGAQCSAAGQSCSGDAIFSAAQQIVAAQQEKIFYDEFLPIFLGTDDLSALVPDQSLIGQFSGAINEFTTAAGRIGHTQVPDIITAGLPGEMPRVEKVKDCLFSPLCHLGESQDTLLYAASVLEASPIDMVVTEDLRNAQVPGAGSALLIDLLATNINRGRDHGLADFAAVREALGFAVTDVATLLPQYVLDAYGSAPVDLIVALFSETRAPGAYLGETAKALWALQFEGLRSTTGMLFDPEFQRNFGDLTMASLIASNTSLSADQFGRSAFLVPTPVPLPPASAALLLGLGGFGLMRRRRPTAGRFA